MGAERRALVVYLAGVFVGALDINIIAPVFPLIARAYHVSLSWVAWAVTAYTVAYVASTVLAGALGDARGHRRMFTLGVLAFAVASGVALLAHTLWLFLLARVLQGAGAGAVYPNAQAEGVSRFPPERRGLALGLFGAVFGLAAIVGPNLGGALGQFWTWRAIFLVSLLVSVAVLALAPRLPTAPPTGRAVPDWQGGLAFAGTLAAVLLALTVTGSGRGMLLFAAALLGLWFAWRQRRAALPFLDPRPFAVPAGGALLAGAALIGLDMSAAVFVPTLAQRQLHFSVLASGLALMPAALSGAVLAGVGGVLTDRVGARIVLQLGLGAGALGGVLLALPGLTVGRFLVAMVVLGLSTAFTMGAPLNRLALALYAEGQAGEALAMAAVFRSVGLAAGPVLLTLAARAYGFAGMFGAVALAALIGAGTFLAVPDVRPASRRQPGPDAAAP